MEVPFGELDCLEAAIGMVMKNCRFGGKKDNAAGAESAFRTNRLGQAEFAEKRGEEMKRAARLGAARFLDEDFFWTLIGKMPERSGFS